VGRLYILDKMLAALDKPREAISPYAPKIFTIKINPNKIRDIIGPGGKVIRAIQSDTDTKIEISDDGTVKVAASNEETGNSALERINEIAAEPEEGAIYEGKVVKTTDFGAFVQILPGTDGLVHISQLAKRRVAKVTDVVKEGDMLKVKVLEISNDGRIRLSHKAVLEEKNNDNRKKKHSK
jgi:polyribonucleotide nucleotidyltransferase